jgi:hypothetical protein
LAPSQKSLPITALEGFDPTIPTSKWFQNYALDHAATGNYGLMNSTSQTNLQLSDSHGKNIPTVPIQCQ